MPADPIRRRGRGLLPRPARPARLIAPTGVIRAVRAGSLAAAVLRAGARGAVVSAHRHAAYVLLPGGPVVALLDEDSPVHPWAVCLPWDPAGFAAGAPARASATELRVGGVAVRLEEMKVEDLRLRTRPPTIPPQLVSRLERWIRPPLCQRRIERDFTAALGALRTGGDVRALAALVGLGDGLTPSGDDTLVGVLAGLDLIREAWPTASGLRRRLAETLAHPLEQRTTRLAAQMLRAAMDGHYPEPVLALLSAVPGAEPMCGIPGVGARSLEEAAIGLLAVGHTSGPAMLAGAAAAIALAREPDGPQSWHPELTGMAALAPAVPRPVA